MTERRSEFDIEQALRDVGARLAYPPAADLLPAVRSRIEHDRGGRGLFDLFRSPLQLAPAVATLALLVLATLAFQPIASSAAEALGLRGITLFRVPDVAEVRPGPVIPADAQRVESVDLASQLAGFTVRVPSALAGPESLYARSQDGAAMVFLVYDARRVLITEVRGSLETQLLGKGIPPGTTVEEVQVNGGRGVWIEGQPHTVFYRAPSGDILTDTVRLAGNVLLWEQDGLLMRIEAQVSREQALRIARSMR